MEDDAIGATMAGREVNSHDSVNEAETDIGDIAEERRFKVGQLVEYWVLVFIFGLSLWPFVFVLV